MTTPINLFGQWKPLSPDLVTWIHDKFPEVDLMTNLLTATVTETVPGSLHEIMGHMQPEGVVGGTWYDHSPDQVWRFQYDQDHDTLAVIIMNQPNPSFRPKE